MRGRREIRYVWFVENISKWSPLNCRSLHFGRRDDKGEGGVFREGWLVAERNSRSLHFAPPDFL